MVLVLLLVEQRGGRATDPSLQAVTLALAAGQRARPCTGWSSVRVRLRPRRGPGCARRRGRSTSRSIRASIRYAPDAWARILWATSPSASPSRTVVAAGSERGNEVMARAAARLDLPLAANVVEAAPSGPPEPLELTRVRWGGSLLERARLHADRRLLTAQPHAFAAAEPAAGEQARVEPFTPELEDADLVVRVRERVAQAGGGISLADAKVVVTGGRGVGSAEGFAVIEELAGLLGGAVGCSRAVTMAGWRPHTDQVGQTGTKIAPEIYVPCGVSGATQHLAGAKGAKRILAINSDPEAPIMASADYAVVGDLHEVVPAISAEIRRQRGG